MSVSKSYGISQGWPLGAGQYAGARVPAPDPSLVSPYKFVLPRGRAGIMTKGLVSNPSCDRNLTQLITRTRAISPVAVALDFYNGGMDNDYNSLPLGEQLGPNPITIRASVERLGTTNTIQRFTFNGQDSITLQPGEFATTDMLTAEVAFGLAAGSTWPVNTFYAIKVETVTPSLGGIWPQGLTGGQSTVNTGGVTGTRADQSFSCTATEGADQVYALGAYVTTGGVTNVSGHVPIAMIGYYAPGVTGPAAPLWFGDSIADNAYPNAFNYFGSGGVFMEQAVRTRQVPYSRYALGSMRSTFYLGRNDMAKRLMSYATQVYWELGTNGLNAGAVTAASLYSIVESAVYDARKRGVKQFIGLPIIPSTSSSDGGATLVNQTYRTNFEPGGQRDIYNNLLRSGVLSPTGPDAFVNTSATVEDPGDNSKFAVNGSPNSIMAPNDAPLLIHPNQTGHTNMAVPVNNDMANRTA